MYLFRRDVAMRSVILEIKERFTMVIVIGRIVAETCFRRKVGIGSWLHCY